LDGDNGARIHEHISQGLKNHDEVKIRHHQARGGIEQPHNCYACIKSNKISYPFASLSRRHTFFVSSIKARGQQGRDNSIGQVGDSDNGNHVSGYKGNGIISLFFIVVPILAQRIIRKQQFVWYDLGTVKKLRNTYLFMRHAEAGVNRLNIVCSDSKKYPLTARGRLVAKRAGRLLRQKCPPQVIYTSPVRRAMATARIVGRFSQAPVKAVKEFRELYFGSYENKSVVDYHASRPRPFERFVKSIGEAETLNHAKRRMAAGFKKIEHRHRGRIILIVSHGDPLWMLESWLLKLSLGAALKFGEKVYLETGEVHRVYEQGGRFEFKSLYRPPVGRGHQLI